MNPGTTRAQRTGAAAGVAIGVAVVLLCWLASGVAHDLPLAPLSLLYAHGLDPALWVIDTMPALLGWLGWLAVQAPTAQARPDEGELSDGVVLDVMLDAVLIVDPDGTVAASNAAAEALFGYGPHELPGMPITRLLPEHDRPQKSQGVERRATTGALLGVEWSMPGRHRSGRTFDALVASGQARSGALVYIVRALRTEEGVATGWRAERARLVKERAEAVESARIKSAFLAGLSHELRTPIHAVIGYAELLGEELSDAGEHISEDLNRITRSARYLLQLLNNILDLSKIEAGHMSVRMELVHAAPLVQEVVDTIRPMADKRGNALAVQVAPEVVVRCDAMRLKQILLNLLGNAAKFTEHGEIRVELTQEGGPASNVVVRVIDDGVGMTEQQVERLFQEYVQVQGASQRRYGGTGLGLALTRRFVELMNGTIEVASRPGEGSTFTVRLPGMEGPNTLVPEFVASMGEATSEHPTAAVPDLEATAEIALLGPECPVAMLDNHPRAVRELQRRELAGHGFTAHALALGPGALERIDALDAAAAVVDLDDPGGWELLDALVERSESRPVIAASANPEDAARATRRGALGWVATPLSGAELAPYLRRAVRCSRGALVFSPSEDLVLATSELLRSEDWTVHHYMDPDAALDAAREHRPVVLVLHVQELEDRGRALADAIGSTPELDAVPTVWISSEEALLGQRIRCRVDPGPIEDVAIQVARASEMVIRWGEGS